MVVGKCLLDIRLYGVRSLKDKRRVIQSLLSRLQQKFGVSCAEVGENDTWGRALVGMAFVTNEGRHAEEVMRSAVLWVEGNIDGEILNAQVDIIT
ncbi:MAG TPA: DUF503 domain-containing protein [Firmicutes bacterium]|nr:DUF503 domain-containing protein [Candidatus Fermentithermobacillaceae bacterium]